MGIPGLWELLGDGEISAISDLAADHFARTGRGLRIAVDEATWRFHTQTPEQVKQIREREPRAHPVEKTLFWRIIPLLTLGVQLIFVFDGDQRPEFKRNKATSGRAHWTPTDLFKQLLHQLKIPFHTAPGEAEAECARLQSLGLVDAVWTEDSDCLMFGCSLVIRDHRIAGNGSKRNGDSERSKTHVRVYRSAEILSQHGLDKRSFILIAMLSGGDYDTTGLRGCGLPLAAQIARCEPLKDLCDFNCELPRWRVALEKHLQNLGTKIQVPQSFPDARVLRYYRSPKVSAEPELHRLMISDDLPLDQQELADFMGTYFNLWAENFMKHIAPVLLVRSLAQTMPGQEASNKCFDLRIVAQRKKASQDSAEIKISFTPAEACLIDRKQTKDGVPWDHSARVDCSILRCFLERGGVGLEEPPKPSKPRQSAKRKSNESRNETNTQPSKHQKTQTLEQPASQYSERPVAGMEKPQNRGLSRVLGPKSPNIILAKSSLKHDQEMEALHSANSGERTLIPRVESEWVMLSQELVEMVDLTSD